MTKLQYSTVFKENASLKVFQRTGKTIDAITNEINLVGGTLKVLAKNGHTLTSSNIDVL